MKGVKLWLPALVALCTLFTAGVSMANVPAPPVNQLLGIDDGIFNNFEEADCRVCHEDPDITGPTSNVDRHHLLYGEPIPEGSVVPNPDANGDGIDDTVYGCLNCHDQDTSGGVIRFLVERDCLACHVQIVGEASVHHLTPTAQGTATDDIGNNGIGDCTPCHGDLVDDIGDGHTIPTYQPSLVTPEPSLDPAAPGACNYCHDAGTDTSSGVIVFSNEDTHHNTGVFIDAETGLEDDSRCLWCHNTVQPQIPEIRFCEGCHGLESLHNIQADSNGNGVVPLGELYGYGHIGIDNPPNESDCFGCHGFSVAADTAEIGSGVPTIYTATPQSITAGANAVLTVTGAAFSNATALVVRLTDAGGNTLTFNPNGVTDGSLTVTVNAAPGNYTLQAVKDGEASNAVNISIKPAVVITEIDCSKCLGTMTITGSGFSEKPEGTDEDLYVIEGDGGRLLQVISWTDTEIKVIDARCRGDVTVNALFGSATAR